MPDFSREEVDLTRPTALRFAMRYSDDSGDEMVVSFNEHGTDWEAGYVIIEAADEIRLRPEKLDWLIGSLLAVRQHLIGTGEGGRDG